MLRIVSRVMLAVVSVASIALLPQGSPVNAQSPTVKVTDLGLQSGYQDTFFGHYQRGRTTVAADFDLDGRVDFYQGNPGDDSMVLRNLPGPHGAPRFVVAQVLLTGALAWGGVAFDYDNDGDPDLFVTEGGNEGIGFNHLFRNLWLESGGTLLSFEEVTQAAGVAGPVPPGHQGAIPVANANAVVADYDRDGFDDVFVNVNIVDDSLPELLGRNVLWHNDGNGTFSDVTDAVGIGGSRESTRHSTFLDVDNDGDLDLYENNYNGRNILWRNQLVEDGVARFEDVTDQFSPPGEDIGYPLDSFGSAAADFNNDGWEDLVVFMRPLQPGDEPGSPYHEGHALFMNLAGTGFANIAGTAGLNDQFQEQEGVMGCQVGDLSGDGTPDIYIGNGGADRGETDRYFEADSPVGLNPHFANLTSLVDFPAPARGHGQSQPPYPYRTHGTVFVDVDNDGSLEMAISNGGPAASGDEVREPNRLFKFTRPIPPNWIKVRAIGDGSSVSRDAIGTRFALTVSRGGGQPWTIHRTLFGGSCFSAQNPMDVHFGLGDADTIHELEITWPDGTIETRTEGLSINGSIVVERSKLRGSVSGQPGHAETWLAGWLPPREPPASANARQAPAVLPRGVLEFACG